jgi:hypothetical protein
MTLSNPERLIGATFDSREMAGFLEWLGDPRRDRFAEMDIYEYPSKGMALYCDKTGHIVSVFLYGAQDHSHASYDGPMPRDVSFDDSRNDVIGRLGTPSISGHVKESGASWDRFDSSDISIHVQYCPGADAIEMVTLMSSAMARGEI